MKIRKMEVPFTQIANSVLNDKRLSWKAKGIFAYIYSKPDDWDFSTHRIQHDSSDSMRPLVSGIKELEDFGYLKRKKLTTGRVEYIIDYTTQNPDVQNAYQANRHVGESLPISNKDIQSNKETNKGKAAAFSSYGKKGSMEAIILSEEQKKMMADEAKGKRAHAIIGAFVSYKMDTLKHNIRTKGQLYEFWQRHIKTANKLKTWDDDQLERAFEKADKEYQKIEWSLEALLKYLTK